MIEAATVANVLSWFAQIALVVAAAGLLPILLRLDAPDVRYVFWRAVLGVCLVLPWLQGRVVPSGATDTATSLASATPGPMVSASAVPVSAPVDWIAIAVWVAMAGAALRLAWIAIGCFRLQRLRRAGETFSSSAEIDDLQRILGTSAEIRYVSPLHHPVTFGVLRPVVLMPASLRDQPAQIQRAVLAHELLHVARRDWAWLLAEEALRAAFWFHPAVWWLISRVQLAREEVVDELAVLVTGRRREYVEALLAFADRVPLAPAPAFARRRHLFRRMLLISREAGMSSKRIVASAAVMALALVAGTRYAVAAFPLQGRGGSGPAPSAAGPLEQRANPITPENPIPRRISHVDAEYPPEAQAAGVKGRVTLSITVDGTGRVAEARPIKIGISTARPQTTIAFENPSTWDVTRLTRSTPDGAQLQPVIDALIGASLTAVRGWQYEAPFNAPISFKVDFWFGTPPPPPPPPPAPAARAAAAPPGPPPPPPAPAATQKTPGMPPPPPPPAVMSAATTSSQEMMDGFYEGAIRVGGQIRPPAKIRDVRPVYPEIAREARVQGVVIVEARIEPDGTVSRVRILRSIPLLDEAALDAVTQWQFTPTLLNGNPIPLIMTMTVNFTLQ